MHLMSFIPGCDIPSVTKQDIIQKGILALELISTKRKKYNTLVFDTVYQVNCQIITIELECVPASHTRGKIKKMEKV